MSELTESLEHSWNKKLAGEGLAVADSTNFFLRDAAQGCGLLVTDVGSTPSDFEDIAGAAQHRNAGDDVPACT